MALQLTNFKSFSHAQLDFLLTLDPQIIYQEIKKEKRRRRRTKKRNAKRRLEQESQTDMDTVKIVKKQKIETLPILEIPNEKNLSDKDVKIEPLEISKERDSNNFLDYNGVTESTPLVYKGKVSVQYLFGNVTCPKYLLKAAYFRSTQITKIFTC